MLHRLRPMESRFVGWPWSPVGNESRHELDAAELRTLAKLIATVETAARARDDADALAALGRIQAVRGRWDDAADSLRLATVLAPERADLHADHAAVLIHQGVVEDDPARLLEAIQTLDRALDLDAALVEARFNRSIALSTLGLVELAATSWKECLAREGDDGWRNDASRRLAALDVETLAERWQADLDRLAAGGWQDGETLELWAEQDVERLFELVLFRLLPEWSMAVSAGQIEAEDRALDHADRVASVIARVAGDSQLSDAVHQAEAAGGQTRLDLARAVADLARAVEGFDPNDCAARAPLLAETASQLEALQSSLRFTASYNAMPCVLGKDALEATRAIEDFSTTAIETPYPLLHTRVVNLRALAAGIEGRLDDAIGLRIALDLEASRLPRRAAQNQVSIGYLAERLGRYADAWEAHTRALQISSILGEPAARDTVLQGVELFLFHTENRRLAASISEEMASRTGPQPRRLHWLMRLMAGRSMLEDYDGARAAERLATEWLASKDDPVWNIERRHLEEARSSLLVHHDAAAALRAAESAKAQRAPGSPESLDVSLAEATALRILERGDEAERRLQRILVGLDERHPADDVERQSFLWRHRRYYEALVELLADTEGAELSALAWIDWFKHRSFATDPTDDFTRFRARLEKRIAEIPPSTSVVAWAVLPHRVLVWRIDNKGLRLAKVTYEREELGGLVRRFLVASELGAGRQRLRDLGSELYAALLRPVEPLPDGRVILVPDLFLHELPFGSLPLDRDGTSLGELELELAPSIGAAHRPPSGSPAPRWKLLAVGAPADSGRHLGLAELPLAVEEAHRVTALVPDSTLLVGSDATVTRFVAVAPDAEVVHFAAHALSDAERAGGSVLLLHPAGPNESGSLRASQIASLQLDGVRLVYLSSCGIPPGPVRPSPIALPRTLPELPLSFLRAGAHRVVAGLAPLPDARAVELAATFYRLLAEGRSPARSLRETAQSVTGVQIWVHPSALFTLP